MARIVATQNLNFYADPVNGSPSYDGSSPTFQGGTLGPLSEIQDAVTMLKDDYDLDGAHSATIHAAAGTYGTGLSFSGKMRGLRTPGDLTIRGAGPTSTIIAPTGGAAGAEINYDAKVWLDNLGFDMTNSAQDAIITGKGADFTIGNLRWTGIASNHNYITESEHCRMTVMANLWCNSDAQCFLQMDQYSTAYWNTNGVPNQLAIWLEHINGGAQPHWWDAMLDVADSNLNIQNVDYNGWNGAYTGTGPNNATGYRARIRSGGVINLNSLGLSTLPGSADTNWPIQGYVL